MNVALSLLLSASLAVPNPDVSSRETVQALADKADAAFRRGDIEAARAALLEAIAVEPENMNLVFGLAQAERFLGNCDRAVELYDRFLRSGPAPEQADAAVAKRAECTDAPPPSVPPPVVEAPSLPEPQPEPQPTPQPDTDTDRPEQPRPWAGPVLVGVGAAVAIAGAAVVTAAFVSADRAPQAPDQGEYERRADRARPLAIGGWSTLGVGVGLAIAGGVVWGVQWKRGRSRVVWMVGGQPRVARRP